MKVIDILNSPKPTISLEVFPPKTDAVYASVEQAVEKIADLKPSYMSVTYGAGGGTSSHTVNIAKHIQCDKGVTAIAHLSCISSTHDLVHQQLIKLKEAGIENILALRGDIPEGFEMDNLDYHYASDLAKEISDFGGFCIGGACYPEGHPDSANSVEDIDNLKKKIDAGCQYLTTQMFFDNNIHYKFLYKTREKGIFCPIIPGIMPITNAKQVERAIKLSGTIMPPRFLSIVDRFGDDKEAMAQAGIAYATDQIIDLIANGINHIHVYSMNKPEVAQKILENLSSIVDNKNL
ncbi:MAG: methylenetetrahydrofolate reductase [NAD(P)H] [Treponema sp.]|uniref:methylenetetrahydrofolate reductase [NAD(P)H] n=1 Tax=Treponema sp. TaxID=166 RepID=UPI001D389DF8|nr:methylenetetrahydrofolate reductase [NAD(P)H] [Treponema sp.]MBS7310667.1 methylenetetrahydrofolate reductase [NAD(P)H] [Treponema sp.]MCI5696313.1 methylenetetrahydrofolate reductase [NAD(P)H] [Spirochaetia bacterium]MDY5885994.1 methylenetetrahydrofolate reductase [NAD(P)H] [Treponema sp.]